MDDVETFRNRSNGQAVDERRARIIEGAAQCFVRYGVAKSTIDDVASAVPVSRRTIYRYFENKNALFTAVVTHEMEELTRESRALYKALPFADAVVEVALVMSRRVAESPTLSGLFASGSAGESLEVLFGEQEFLDLVRRFLLPYIHQARLNGDLRADIEADDAVEWLTHVMFSLLGPKGALQRADDAHLRHLLQTFLLPGLTS
jgi:AcrR family transcriptional regulator